MQEGTHVQASGVVIHEDPAHDAQVLGRVVREAPEPGSEVMGRVIREAPVPGSRAVGRVIHEPAGITRKDVSRPSPAARDSANPRSG